MLVSSKKLCDAKRLLSDLIYSLCGHVMSDDKLLTLMVQHTGVMKRDQTAFQKLEFLGDKVLSLCVGEMLYQKCENEAQMSRILSRVTGTESLRTVALQHLENIFLIAPSAQGSSALADMVEVVIAGVYLDAGLDVVRRFVSVLFSSVLQEPDSKDCKSLLQEYSQSMKGGLPQYHLIERSGPDHAPLFCVRVTCLEQHADGQGTSIKKAEHHAAQNMLAMCGVKIV